MVYYTGDLETADDRHFGYQLTFFRRGLVPLVERQALVFVHIFPKIHRNTCENT
jgi:predicted secreted hydrolase